MNTKNFNKNDKYDKVEPNLEKSKISKQWIGGATTWLKDVFALRSFLEYLGLVLVVC